jgi:hypothetical protein
MDDPKPKPVPPPAGPPPNDSPPIDPIPPPAPPPPNMDTKSSNGLLELPARRLAAAGVDDNTCVAARPESWSSVAGASSKSSRFSACWPAATVWSAFCASESLHKERETALVYKEPSDSQ